MPESRTGPVRVSGYAIKLRRVVNAALKEYYREKKIDIKNVNEVLSALNAKIYSVLVERFAVPKDAIINIILNYEVEDSNFVVKDVAIEVYDLNEILTRNATSEIRRYLGLAT